VSAKSGVITAIYQLVRMIHYSALTCLTGSRLLRILRAIQMGTSDPGRQFIMIPFRELDSPAFMRLARSPEFSTYLTLRRYIWRSSEPHSRNLQQWYAQGYLCCGLTRARIAQCLGGEISIRSVGSDIARLLQHGVIEVAGAGRQQVFILGRWRKNGEVYVEHRLGTIIRRELAAGEGWGRWCFGRGNKTVGVADQAPKASSVRQSVRSASRRYLRSFLACATISVKAHRTTIRQRHLHAHGRANEGA